MTQKLEHDFLLETVNGNPVYMHTSEQRLRMLNEGLVGAQKMIFFFFPRRNLAKSTEVLEEGGYNFTGTYIQILHRHYHLWLQSLASKCCLL